MNYKKVLFWSILALVLVMPLIAAQSEATTTFTQDLNNFISGAGNVVKTFTITLLGQNASTDAAGYFLVLALVLLVVFGLLDSIKIFTANPWINFGIAAVVGILGTRYIPKDSITGLSTPATALVALIVVGVPLLIVFLVTTRDERLKPHARLIWTIYIVMGIVLFVYNYTKATKQVQAIIGVGILLGIIGWIFAKRLAAIGTLQEDVKNMRKGLSEQREILVAKIEELREAQARAKTPEKIAAIEARIAEDEKALGALIYKTGG